MRRLRQVKGWTGGQVEAGFYGDTAVVYYDAAGNQLDTWELAKLCQNSDGNLCGDTRFAEVEPIVEAITPVPGGVGAVTTAILASHVIEAARRS